MLFEVVIQRAFDIVVCALQQVDATERDDTADVQVTREGQEEPSRNRSTAAHTSARIRVPTRGGTVHWLKHAIAAHTHAPMRRQCLLVLCADRCWLHPSMA